MTAPAVAALVVLLLALAALAAVAETAISRMGRAKAIHLAQEKNTRSAHALLKIAEDPAPFLNIALLLKLASHVTATVIATSFAVGRWGAGETIAAGAMTFAVFTFVELVPRTFTVQRSDAAALRMARVVFAVGRLLQPLGNVLLRIANAFMVLLPGRGLPKGPFVTEEEIRHMVDVAEEEEEIEEEERELIHSVFEFGDTVVREVMVPRPDMVTVRADANLNEALKTILEAGYSRIPIFEGDTDNITGVLYAKDLLKQIHEKKKNGGKVASLGRAPLFVPEQKKVAELLREMQQQRIHMAIVVDEYGGTAGLVTIEDLIEEIVGEIVDEYDQEEPLVEPVDDETIRVDAKMPIDEVNELLDVNLPHEEWDTVGGLVFGLTG
ncbi:MAG: hemolysin family protein, partial [Actinomycetota bacterium]|nr:hemolysin family protein [Actinomycetota bacterium]